MLQVLQDYMLLMILPTSTVLEYSPSCTVITCSDPSNDGDVKAIIEANVELSKLVIQHITLQSFIEWNGLEGIKIMKIYLILMQKLILKMRKCQNCLVLLKTQKMKSTEL